jgi:hypothetical protein
MSILCIPRVNSNIPEIHIRKTLEELNLGCIQNIDVVPKNNGKGDKFNRIFIHLTWNHNLENAKRALDILSSGKKIKVLHDDKYIWRISAYREPKNKPTTNKKHQYDNNQPEHETHHLGLSISNL